MKQDWFRIGYGTKGDDVTKWTVEDGGNRVEEWKYYSLFEFKPAVVHRGDFYYFGKRENGGD